MSERSRGRLGSTGLAQRLADAARSTARSRPDGVGRCAVPVAVDPWGAVSERCPLRPSHEGEHEVESAAAQRERLEQAASIEPTRVLGAVEVVEAWLAGATWSDEPTPPLRELWTLLDVAGARAALDAVDPRANQRVGEVATDG